MHVLRAGIFGQPEDFFGDAVFDDAQPAFGVTRLMSSGYGGKTADRVKPEDVSLASVDRLPAWLPRKAGFYQR